MSNKEVGMYAIATNPEGNVKIGRFTLCAQSEGRIWISDDKGGDAGEFLESDLESAIKAFYDSRF